VARITSPRARRPPTSDGIGATDVLAALEAVGPVGDFLARTQTRDAVRGGEWFMPRIGHHATYDRWEGAGRPDVVGQARVVAMAAIAGHVPLPFADGVAEELVRLERAARGS